MDFRTEVEMVDQITTECVYVDADVTFEEDKVKSVYVITDNILSKLEDAEVLRLEELGREKEAELEALRRNEEPSGEPEDVPGWLDGDYHRRDDR